MNKNKKPKCKLIGEDGNIFNLMGIASRTLKKNGLKKECEEMIERIEKSHRYSEALMIIEDYVEIVGYDPETEDNDFDLIM